MKTALLLQDLESLGSYWANGIKGIGHTYALRVGSINCDCFVLAHTMRHAIDIVQGDRNRALSPDSLPSLRGNTRPLVADHFVMGRMLLSAAEKIRELQARLADRSDDA